MRRILVTSTSALKISAVREYFAELRSKIGFTGSPDVDGINCDALGLPSQPIHSVNSNKGQGNVFKFAIERIRYAEKTCEKIEEYDLIISIENGIAIGTPAGNENSLPLDVCYVVIMSPKSRTIVVGNSQNDIPVPLKQFEELERNYELKKFADGIIGYDMTIGELLAKLDVTIDAKNWMKTFCGIDRKTQIVQALKQALMNLSEKKDDVGYLMSKMDFYKDYPKEGVDFQDIMPILGNCNAFDRLIRLMSYQYDFEDIDVVVGLESRGFLLGAPLASYMKKGFIPIRKAGKLPGKVIQETYEKEYGTDVCEIQESSLGKNVEKASQTKRPRRQRVLIVDDIIATGGSIRAAINLVERCGGTVVDCLVLQEVLPLRDACKKKVGRNYTVLFNI